MSPEQARGEIAAMGPASDVYSLGAILYELLAGHMPYVPVGARLNAYAVWALAQQSPPTPIAQLAPKASNELVPICEKAMQRDPAARYVDMVEMAEDLRAFVEGRVVKAHRTGAIIEFRKWVTRNKALALASAAALVFAIAGLSVTVYVQARRQRARHGLRGRQPATIPPLPLDVGVDRARPSDRAAAPHTHSTRALLPIEVTGGPKRASPPSLDGRRTVRF